MILHSSNFKYKLLEDGEITCWFSLGDGVTDSVTLVCTINNTMDNYGQLEYFYQTKVRFLCTSNQFINNIFS